MSDQKPAEKQGLIKRVWSAIRGDSWQNVLTGTGTSYDKRKATTFAASRRIHPQQLAKLYVDNGITRKIVDLPANDMTRNWLKVKGDDDDKVLMRMEELKTKQEVTKGIKWGRLFGCGIVVMGIDDGGELEEPVNEANVRSVDSLTVFDRREVVIEEQDLQFDMGQPDFLEPQMYEITPVTGPSVQVRVHTSRCMRFRGVETPRQELVSNSYFDLPVLQAIYDNLRQYGGVFDSAEFIVEDFIQTLIKMEGVMAMMRSKEGQATVKARLNLFDQSRSSANTLIVDTNEDYSKHSSTVTGLPDLLDRFMMTLSAVTGIPVTKLFGRSPAGENATGEADTRFYYDDIKSSQEDEVSPELEKLVRLLFIAQGGEPEKWSIQWNPLITPTPKEKAELYKINAEGDAVAVNSNVADPAELEEYRYGGATYNSEPPTYEVPKERDEPPPPEMPPIPPIQPPVIPPIDGNE